MSSDYLRIEMGKALHGDCLLVEWTETNVKHRMLIDGGPIGAYEALATRIAALSADEPLFELMVLSWKPPGRTPNLYSRKIRPRATCSIRSRSGSVNGSCSSRAGTKR